MKTAPRCRSRALNFEWTVLFLFPELKAHGECRKPSLKCLVLRGPRWPRELLPRLELASSFMRGRFMRLLSDLHALEVELWIHCFCTRHTACKTFPIVTALTAALYEGFQPVPQHFHLVSSQEFRPRLGPVWNIGSINFTHAHMLLFF